MKTSLLFVALSPILRHILPLTPSTVSTSRILILSQSTSGAAEPRDGYTLCQAEQLEHPVTIIATLDAIGVQGRLMNCGLR